MRAVTTSVKYPDFNAPISVWVTTRVEFLRKIHLFLFEGRIREREGESGTSSVHWLAPQMTGPRTGVRSFFQCAKGKPRTWATFCSQPHRPGAGSEAVQLELEPKLFPKCLQWPAWAKPETESGFGNAIQVSCMEAAAQLPETITTVTHGQVWQEAGISSRIRY